MGILSNTNEEVDEKVIHFLNVNAKDLLVIFTRNPELGKCKTRLASKIGDRAALDVYKFLLQHTVNITKNLNVHKAVYYSETIGKNDVWDNLLYDKKLQQGCDLGERMGNAFQDGFSAEFEKICIIGSDMFDLSPADINAAFSALAQNDFVIGPAHDGGYYLLGMKKWKQSLFENKEWGKNRVLQDTLANLENEKVHLLETRNDVDIYEDIAHVKAFQPFLKHMTE